MLDLEVGLSNVRPEAFTRLDEAIDALCRSHCLSVTMKSTLAKYPGSIHWHIKKERERGTLEATSWPAKCRVWFSMQDDFRLLRRRTQHAARDIQHRQPARLDRRR